MPKNKEHQLSALNRFSLLKERRLFPKKQESIPHILKLNSVFQLEKWIDIIEKRINGLVNSTTCKSYSNKKLSELQLEIKKLKKSHIDFSKKAALLKTESNQQEKKINPEETDPEKDLFMKNLFDGESLDTHVFK